MATRRLEFRKGTSNKFWEVSVEGTRITVRFGRIGTKGQTKAKQYASVDEALAAAEKQLGQKLAKGYGEVAVGTSDATAASTADSSGLDQQLAELEQWLAANRPDVWRTLLPPAAPADIERLLNGLRANGFPNDELPEELVTLLSWRAGQRSNDGFFLNRDFMRIDWIIECHEIMVGHGDENLDGEPAHFHRGWIPFLDNSYSLLCVDAVGTFGHAPGAIVFVDFKGGESRDIVVPSLGSWVEYFLALVRHPEVGRAFTVDEQDEDYDELREALFDLEDRLVGELFPGYPIAHTCADVPDSATAERMARVQSSQLIFLKLEKRADKTTWRWECDVDGTEVTERLIEVGKGGSSTSHRCATEGEALALANRLKEARLGEDFEEPAD